MKKSGTTEYTENTEGMEPFGSQRFPFHSTVFLH